jgi:hypothetical protein
MMNKTYKPRHGGPYDRGSADAWYGREFNPHYFKGATYQSDKVEQAQMTEAEIQDYARGYEETPFLQKEYC